jgi:hypothetical protein
MDRTQRDLNKAFDQLEAELPDGVSRALEWLRSPQSRWVRIPVALLCIAAGFFWYLPVIGIEWLVVGLLLLAQDVPFLRGPVARFTLWLEAQWCRLKRWWRRRRARNGVVRPTRRGC